MAQPSDTRERGAEQAGEGISDLSDLLGLLDDRAEGESRVSVEMIVDVVGQRSFGPLLLIAGLVGISPIGDIPGVPSMLGAMVLLVSAQLLMRRKGFWLPGWLCRRSVSADRFRKAVKWLRRPARAVDRLLRPRLGFLTGRHGRYAIAAIAAFIGVAMVPMELIPFSATGAALTLVALGLALIAGDGLLALAAFTVFGGTAALVVWQLT